MTLLGLAARNVLRNRRRSLLNITAIGLGVALMVVCLGWVQGYATYIYSAIIGFQTGSAQLLREGYEEVSARFPLDLTLPEYHAVRTRLLENPDVAGASGRIDFAARIIGPAGSLHLLGQGIDAAAERDVSLLSRKIVRGDYLDGRPGLLLGEPVARKLGVGPGATLLVSATDRYGVENRIALPLKGVFSFGYGAMDDALVYLDLGSAQDLLGLDDEVTRIVLSGRRTDLVLAAASSFAKALDSGGLPAGVRAPYPKTLAYGWEEFAKATVSGVRADSDSFYVVAVILFALIIVGILNSMSMSVHERYRELAALRAIGFRSSRVRGLVLLEGGMLAAFGMTLGFLVAAPIAVWLGIKGVDIASYIPKDFPVPFGEIYHADYRFWHFLLSALLALGASAVGAILPARRAAGLPIAETLGAGL